MPPSNSSSTAGSGTANSAASQQTSIFKIPPVIRTLFDSFPLATYPPEAHPVRSPRPSRLPTLYVWLSPTEAHKPHNLGRSFDPECLKWQTYLRFSNIEYRSIPSSNHACSGGPGAALPFLIPATIQQTSLSTSPSSGTSSSSTVIIPSQKLLAWIRANSRRKLVGRKSQGKAGGSNSSRRRQRNGGSGSDPHDQSATSPPQDSDSDSDISSSDELDPQTGPVLSFHTLLSTELTNAILYTTHLVPINKQSYLHPLIYPGLKHPLSLLTSLILPPSPIKLPQHLSTRPGDEIIADGISAIDALAGALGGDIWFLGGRVPGVMDAEAFAYLDVILRGGWEDDRGAGLVWAVRNRSNLVQFWRRVLDGWWGGIGGGLVDVKEDLYD